MSILGRKSLLRPCKKYKNIYISTGNFSSTSHLLNVLWTNETVECSRTCCPATPFTRSTRKCVCMCWPTFDFRLVRQSSSSDFFSSKKKKRGEKEERKEGGKAGIAPWKLARLEKGEDSRKLKPACRRRQWGREKFDLDFPRNWYAYQYTGSFITLVDNSVLTRRLIRKRRNGLNARRTMQWVRVRCFRSIKREFLVFEIGWIRIAREGRKFHFFSLDFFSLFTRKEGGRRGKRTFLIRDFVNLKRSPVIIWKYQNFPVPWKRCWAKIVKIGNISSFFY